MTLLNFRLMELLFQQNETKVKDKTLVKDGNVNVEQITLSLVLPATKGHALSQGRVDTAKVKGFKEKVMEHRHHMQQLLPQLQETQNVFHVTNHCQNTRVIVSANPPARYVKKAKKRMNQTARGSIGASAQTPKPQHGGRGSIYRD